QCTSVPLYSFPWNFEFGSALELFGHTATPCFLSNCAVHSACFFCFYIACFNGYAIAGSS
ncbi:MAG: hypothetical protein ACK53Y_00255, partial [bacterium]